MDEFPEVVVEKPSHTPFTISSPLLYFIGFLDMVPDGIGNHVRNEMGGLWRHPLRIIRNIWLEDSGHIMVPLRCRISGWYYECEFQEEKLRFSFPQFGRFTLEIAAKEKAETNLMLDLAPTMVWLTPSSLKPVVQIVSEGLEMRLPGHQWVLEARIRRSKETLKPGLNSIKIGGGCQVDVCLSNYDDGVIQDTDSMKYYSERIGFSLLECNNDRVMREMSFSKINLLQLISHVPGIGTGLTAGHPDFPWFFGIDTMLSIPGMLYTGMFEEVIGALNILSTFSKNGRIPHEIVTNGVVYNQGDLEESAFFPWRAIEYLKFSGDMSGFTTIAGTMWNSLKYMIENGFTGHGIMEDPNSGEGIDIDTVSIFARSVKEVISAPEMIFETRDSLDLSDLRSILESTQRMIRNDFWIKEKHTFANRIVSGVPVSKGFWTSLFPFYCGIADENQYWSFVNEGGLSAISNQDEIILEPSGNSMPINTGMMAVSAWNFDDDNIAERFFGGLRKSLGKWSPASFPEISTMKSGCYLQAWSAAIYLECLLHGILRIRVGDENIQWKPERGIRHLGNRFTVRRFRYRSSSVDLSFP